MTPPEIVAIIESAPTAEARKLIRQNRLKAGFSGQYYQEVVARLGSSPQSAQRLASFWKEFESNSIDQYDSQRIRAIFERTKGKWLNSAQALSVASASASSDLLKWQCLSGAIDAYGRAGLVDRAEALAKKLVAKLIRYGDYESAGRACINAGNAQLWHDGYARAQYWFLRGRRLLDRSNNEFAKASIELGLSTCFLFTSTTKKVIESAVSAADSFRKLGQNSYAALAKVNEGQALLRTGQADEARRLFLEVRDQPISVFDHARIEEFLGDAYLRLNLFEEAIDAFRSALDNPSIKSLPMNEGNCHLGIGDAEASLGRFESASVHYRSAKRIYSRFGNKVWEKYSELRILQANSGPQLKRAEALVRFFAENKCRLLEVEALLVLGRSTDDIGKLARRKAMKNIIRWGFEHLRWQVERAEALASTGKARLAAYRRMCRSIIRSRQLVSSRSGIVAYYRDKDAAMAEFLELLLNSGSKRKIEEAIGFISDTRSSALLDEAQSLSASLPIAVQRRISELRQVIAETLNTDWPRGRTRRTLTGEAPPISLRRAWNELDTQHIEPHQRILQVAPGTLVFARGQDSFYAIEDGRCFKVPESAESISRAIRWLRFELLQPLVGGRTSHQAVEELATLLKKALWDPYIPTSTIERICPDDVLWQAPWQLFAAMDSMEFEIPISPWPSTIESSTRNFAGNSAIWYFPHSELPLILDEANLFLSINPNARVCSTVSDARKCLIDGDFDLLHIVGHASQHRTNPMFSAICAEDGRIFANEIANSSLKVKTVVLSACDTGAVSGNSRTEIDGMTRAFLARGAEDVIATQWPLQDESAGLFMRLMYTELSSGRPLRGAIASARRQTRDVFPHPYYWGAPILYRGISK